MTSTTGSAASPALKLVTQTRQRRNRQIGQIIQQSIVYALLLFLSLLFLFPLFWMVTTALKTNAQIYVWPPQWIPDPVQWSNFSAALNDPYLPFTRFFANTL